MKSHQASLFFSLILFALVIGLVTCSLRRAAEETNPTPKGNVFNQALLAAKGSK